MNTPRIEKKLGKIKHVRFGHGGYQDACIGLSLTFSGNDGWGTGTFVPGGWQQSIEPTEHSEWAEEDRDKQRAECIKKIDELLTEAKVQCVTQLKDIPIEATFDGMMLKDWRILTEVL